MANPVRMKRTENTAVWEPRKRAVKQVSPRGQYATNFLFPSRRLKRRTSLARAVFRELLHNAI